MKCNLAKIILAASAGIGIFLPELLPIPTVSSKIFAQEPKAETELQKKGESFDELIGMYLQKERTRPNKSREEKIQMVEAYFDFIYGKKECSYWTEKDPVWICSDTKKLSVIVEEQRECFNRDSPEYWYLSSLEVVVRGRIRDMRIDRTDLAKSIFNTRVLCYPSVSSRIKSNGLARFNINLAELKLKFMEKFMEPSQLNKKDIEDYIKITQVDPKNEGAYFILFRELYEHSELVFPRIASPDDRNEEKDKKIIELADELKKVYDAAILNIDPKRNQLTWAYLAKINFYCGQIFTGAWDCLSDRQKKIKKYAKWAEACFDESLKIADTCEVHMCKSGLYQMMKAGMSQSQRSGLFNKAINEFEQARSLAKSNWWILDVLYEKARAFILFAEETGNADPLKYTKAQKEKIKKALDIYTEALEFCESEAEDVYREYTLKQIRQIKNKYKLD